MKKIISLVSALCICGLGIGLVSACQEIPKTYLGVEEAAHTHSYTSEVTTAATCTEDGLMTYTCECGDSYTESIPATGHTWGAAVYNYDEDTNSITWTRTCDVCGYSEELSHEELASLEEAPVLEASSEDALSAGLTVDGATIVLAPEASEEGDDDEVPTLELGSTLTIAAEDEEIEVTVVVSSETALVTEDEFYNGSYNAWNSEEGKPLISVGSGATLNLVLEEGSTISGSASSWGWVDGTGSAIAGEYGGLIAVMEGGNLVISGDGDIVQELAGAAVLYVAKGGSCTVNGGNFSVDRGINYTIINDGDLTFNGGSVTTKNNRSSLIKSGDDNRQDYESLYLGGETLTINGGTFIGGKHTISNCLSGTLTITGGYFDGCLGYNVSNTTIQNENTIKVTELIEDKSGNATISGGTFGHEATELDPVLFEHTITIDATSTEDITENVVTITGGTFYAGYSDMFNLNAYGEVLVSSGVLSTLSDSDISNVTVASEPDSNGLFAITKAGS